MEQRNDYIETQIDMLTKMLLKLLEKLLNVTLEDKNVFDENNFELENISLEENLTIKELIDNNYPNISQTLINNYGYTTQQIKLLADVLYKYSTSNVVNNKYCLLALQLYDYYFKNSGGITDFTTLQKNEILKNKLET